MLPIQIVGLALAGRALLTKYTDTYPEGTRIPIHIPKIKLPDSITKQFTEVNPLESLSKTLAPSLSRLKKIAFGDSRANDNYSDIVKKYTPKNATHLIPERPSYTDEIHLTDLDGDSQKEVIASYRLNNEIRTIILKKQKDTWIKASEIKNPGYSILNYRDVADITGTGRRHLLLGLSSRGKPSMIYGYSMEGGNAKEVFAHSYNRLDVLHKAGNKNAPYKTDLVIWNKQSDDTYDIGMYRWNGLELETVQEDLSSYYKKKAVPYLVMKARQSSNTAANWYNLANALVKAGSYTDALTAVNIGMDVDKNSTFKDRFIALKNEFGVK